MDEQSTPAWAVELMIKFERLDAKISAAEERNGGHSDWATRNIKDHEMRLRSLEQYKWVMVGLSVASGGLGAFLSKMIGA